MSEQEFFSGLARLLAQHCGQRTPASGNLYVFGQRVSFENAGWLDLSGEGLRAEMPETSYGGYRIWGIPE